MGRVGKAIRYRVRQGCFEAADRVWLSEARARGLTVEPGARMQGRPNIQCLEGEIILREGAILRSRDFQYHSHILPVRLLVDKKGALIEIGPRSRINGSAIHAQSQIRIGADCYIASGVTIIDTDGHTVDPSDRVRGERDQPAPIQIGDRVWIGLNAIVRKGVTIGDGSVIGAGAIVNRSIPANVVAAGQPARVIKEIDP